MQFKIICNGLSVANENYFATDYLLQMKITLQRIFHCNLNLQRKFRCNVKLFATDCPLKIEIAFQIPLNTVIWERLLANDTCKYSSGLLPAQGR